MFFVNNLQTLPKGVSKWKSRSLKALWFEKDFCLPLVFKRCGSFSKLQSQHDSYSLLRNHLVYLSFNDIQCTENAPT